LLLGIAMVMPAQADVVSNAPPEGNRAGGSGVLNQRSLNLVIPRINMQRDDGQAVQLDREIDDGRPVFVNFSFAACFGICPISSQTFAQIQSRLGDIDGFAMASDLIRIFHQMQGAS
jgi:cytochrome oxidase Cu insertion factor (SCO1/SenC/PrrC family)